MRLQHVKKAAICSIAAIATSLVVALGACGLAFADTASLQVSLSDGSCVREQNVNGNDCLFLPSQADLRSLNVESPTGSLWAAKGAEDALVPILGALDLCDYDLASSDGVLLSNGLSIWLSTDGQTRHCVNLYQSQGIRSVFVNTEHDRSYVDSSGSHSTKDTGTFSVLNADGSSAVAADMEFIRGRGNTTWTGSDKKPYQVKLKKKADVLGDGQKSKTWLLLANAADPTLLRNTVCFNLARYMGSTATPSCEPCDFYYNGEYRGSYLLTEKVKVEKYGVDIDDLDEANEDANEGSDALENPWAYRESATNDRGKDYTYVAGLNNPSNISGGYLIELDDKTAAYEVSMFQAGSHSFIMHTPEIATADEAKYISELFDIGFSAARSGGMDKESGKTVYDVFDIDSLIATGLTEDFIWDGDYLYSSSYFYTPEDQGKIYLGPIWDCDRTFSLPKSFSSSAFARTFLDGNSELLNELGLVEQRMLAPAVRSALLGDASASTQDGVLRSIEYYACEIKASQAMDEVLWGLAPLNDPWLSFDRVEGKQWGDYVTELKSFAQQRIDYLDSFYAQENWTYCKWVWTDSNGWVPYLDGAPCYDGWVDDRGTWYYMSQGRMQTGWCSAGGNWYYFDGSGVMRSGWLLDGGVWYYLKASGSMATGWAKSGSSWYYFDESGAMATGWRCVGDTWYYLDESGAMATGWLLANGIWYLLDDSGAMQTGWQLINDTWYYFDGSGAMATGWQNINGAWFLFNGSGNMLTGWQRLNDTWYYFDSSGAMATGWLLDGETWYLMSISGAMQTGWQFVGDSWYCLESSGAMATGWIYVDGSWYKLSASGAMQTGWIQEGQDWYWCSNSGEMMTGLRSIGGKLYKFDESGRLVE